MTAHAALKTFAACAVLLLAGSCRHADAGVPTIVFRTDETQPDYGVIDVEHVDPGGLATLARQRISEAEWREVLSVHANDTTGLPVLGDYVVRGSTLRFKPAFKPLRGSKYVARFDAGAFNKMTGLHTTPGDARGTWELLPDLRPATTVVDAIYPSADTVPMNLLRLYIHFSAPMSAGDAEKSVHLLDQDGRSVENAFLNVAGNQELWDGAHQRLTIFFDPGRIKRDLKPHEELGLPLRDGRRYRLVIDSAWRDAQGRPLKSGFVKPFFVGKIDRTFPRTANWTINPPRVNTTTPLAVVIPEPLDHALLTRMLVVIRDGKPVEGHVMVSARETKWLFTPFAAWQPGDYAIEVDTELEDLAGNNLKHLFDVMPGDSASRGVTGARVRIPFRLAGS